MAIEGPLRELGIHDVFQLLDLSRKTGTLTVTSALRDNQGTVYFDGGAVVYASIRSNPHPLGQLLVRSGRIAEGDLLRARQQQERGDARKLGELLVEMRAITRRELERQVRFQVEEVVFELTSWSEGYFSFEEGELGDVPAEATIRISTESLLMEGARRIDEWSRIESRVRHLGMVPVLAPVSDDHPTLLDLLPDEWAVLTEIDGSKDIRAIASNLARSEFEVARTVYGLLSTGVVELYEPDGVGQARGSVADDAEPHLQQAQRALRAGDTDGAMAAARQAIVADPQSADARLALARALARAGRHADAIEELHRALQLDTLNADVHLELGYAAAARGHFDEAVNSWDRYLRMMPAAPDAQRVRAAAAAAGQLRALLTEHSDG
ncbi:MAG TPA: DUF4388 domain-containing protein [Gemmatimonadaceae bacterium]|nr:DUF4388 domain-containing protein [Gemmatimonadaceae bacterium]